MAPEDKKTQIGTVGRTVRPTGSQTPVAASTASPGAPAATGTPVPTEAPEKPKTSYLPDVKDPLLGTTLAGRYAIQQKLGEGGMGAVYLATHTILEKQVALKVLHGEFARKPDLVERFMQEAKAASRIRHENVIDISDFGSTPEGHVFFAMELLKGHDLHDEIARARVAGQLLPWSRTKKIFLQICGALSAAHGKGIVHRDLKPENVYLVEFLGDPDFVKLLDFGIAKLTESATEEGGRKLTKTGMLFGTPEYMSPEQARGERVDQRVDIYAMGCILFQLVSGRVPFEADNFMGVLSMHLTEPPPVIAPETFDRIGAPRALGDVIDRALVKDRNARYQTIDELANAVREVSGDPPAADRSQPMRVAAPASTTRARPPTGPVTAGSPDVDAVGAAATAVSVQRTRPPTGRQKTQWTGNLKVPEIEVPLPAAPARSKLPLVLGAIVVLGGGVVAAYVATRGGGGGGANGSAGSATLAAGSAAIAPAPPTPAPPKPAAPELPELARLSLDSTPPGATVTDLASGKPIGKTPLQYSVPGSKTPRQFAFHLHGYADTTVELVPDRDAIAYVEKLVKGTTAGAAVVHVVPVSDATVKAGSAGNAQTGAVTKPDTGESGAVTRPDTTGPSGTVTKPDTAGQPRPDKPDTTGQAKPDKPDKPDGSAQTKPCTDDEMPCLKGFGSGQ
ncbi:MAG: serine/threonine-protein kinase [Acidobacteriota bacterium]